MKHSKTIELEFNRDNLITLLEQGAGIRDQIFSHKQIADWCEVFWLQYSDVDAIDSIEKLMPVLADVETQWDLYLASTFTLEDLHTLDFERVALLQEWFKDWLGQLYT
ncbi:hypothetical protein MHO82_21225 [Vibrio sp. Of7-15]|uniref:hypothetical protein n=1 Tax=Vibrio sp. Of7-15 TaxID=2724879 RepID=UPI001EF2B2B8|nr:hypothetical protein [Vibrio sp. Of7-15]MCG7499392.1 hypothetical protein [Vibrio sp. Of7-15]